VSDEYSTGRYRRLRLEVLDRDGRRCQIRGPQCRGEATQVDHIVPVADGGAMFDPANCRAACSWCNTWRAQRQKSRRGWRRARTRIVLVCGPPGSEDLLSAVPAERARPGDLVIDYQALSKAIGDRPDEVRRLRNVLLGKLRRGEVEAAGAWITSTNPAAEWVYPHHEVVVVDPGREYALVHTPVSLQHLVDEWYERRACMSTASREW
jgi:5-methylcytosine-specific restriction protein A